MIELVEVHEPKASIAPSRELPPLSYTDRNGTLYRLCGEVITPNGGRLGQYVPVFNYSKQPKERKVSKLERALRAQKISFVEYAAEMNKPPKPHWFERFLRWWYGL